MFRRLPPMLHAVASLGLLTLLALGHRGWPDPRPAGRSVFDWPFIQQQFAAHYQASERALALGRLAEAARHARACLSLVPTDGMAHLQVARVLAAGGQPRAAWPRLERAVALGVREVARLREDVHLAALGDRDRWARLRARAEQGEATSRPAWDRPSTAAAVRGGVAWVGRSNTRWTGRVFLSSFWFPGDTVVRGVGGVAPAEPPSATPPWPRSPAEAVRGHGHVGALLRRWYREGTAAGNYGDLYDNRDGDHSNLRYGRFPQLTRIEYDAAVVDRRLHIGLQYHFFYNGATIGNSSTALSGWRWRSQPRLAYATAELAQWLAVQYAHNHLYVYPEHHDHDAGRQGDGGWGDLYCANTPYVIISQGSSRSDRPVLDALACTLAAFRPEVKRQLVRQGALMPAVQMILRRSYGTVRQEADYLSGVAHPTVFDPQQLDVERMVHMAHDMRLENLPPLVRIAVVSEQLGEVGRDYFAPSPCEKLFDTPSAIARVYRATWRRRRMTVTAGGSSDPNERPLRWRWVVLRGDAESVRIRTLDERGSRAEITVAYQPRRPVRTDSPLESNRVDIGVFADNGVHVSAPAFVTFYTLANERRVYRGERIESVTYCDLDCHYADPLVALPKRWRDEYRYDAESQLVGWTRHRPTGIQQFTADGGLVVARDERGRPLEAHSVRYVPRPRPRQAPLLVQQLGDERWIYAYASASDRRGRIVRRLRRD